MSHPLRPPKPSSVRDDARALVKRALQHEDELNAMVAEAEESQAYALRALTDALDPCVGADHLRSLLCSQLLRSEGDADATRRLCAGARAQHEAARDLLIRLDENAGADEPSTFRAAVLVVDDMGEVREFVALILERAGFVVRTAANGLEALLAAYESRPGVILMDVSMPVLDGIEATRLIKAAKATRDARVIAYTGGPVPAGGTLGDLFAAVLEKPATPEMVLATVEQFAGPDRQTPPHLTNH